MIMLDQSQRKCPYCGAVIAMRMFRLHSDSCPSCGRLASSPIVVAFNGIMRFLVKHRKRVCFSVAAIMSIWSAVAYFAFERAKPIASKYLRDLMPPYRMQLAPLDPKKPPMTRLSFTEFLVNPFRRTVTVEVVHFQAGWIPMVINLDDAQTSDSDDSND